MKNWDYKVRIVKLRFGFGCPVFRVGVSKWIDPKPSIRSMAIGIDNVPLTIQVFEPSSIEHSIQTARNNDTTNSTLNHERFPQHSATPGRSAIRDVRSTEGASPRK